MAGAVSAGAYTAGVMDYLLEALEEWEKRRGQPNVPSHRVTIPIMGGASAGGMTAVLAASAVNDKMQRVEPTKRADLAEHPENKLYNSWVDLTGGDVFPKMLDTADIKSGHVTSLLNSDFIDDIAKRMIKGPENWVATPPYFEMPVKVFTTLSNLGGFPYNVDFNARLQRERYDMSVHNDYACFALQDDAVVAAPAGWMPLNFKTGQNLQAARDAAMATGAFPVGLRSRTMKRDAAHVNDIRWLKGIFNKNPLADGTIETLNVDGGLINNEPFEKVRDLLDDMTVAEGRVKFANLEEKSEKLALFNANYNTFANTVLMVDPFPSAAGEKFKIDQELPNIVTKTLSAMLNQMRAKPVEYAIAMQMADASRYIISPARELRGDDGTVNGELFGEKAIACGTLAGFGGFLSKEFRIHDYHLGRWNCEVFLRDYFTVPAEALKENSIFADGYRGVDINPFSSFATGQRRYQIIPIFTERKSGFPVPVFSSGNNWPSMARRDVEKFEDPLRKRAEKVLLGLANQKGMRHLLLWIGAKVVLNKMLAGKVSGAIKSSLTDWKLLR
jgi:predicted acylesterase/phospholipase RssA